MPQTTTIKSLPVAFAMMKAMQAAGVDGARTIAAPSAKRSPNCSKAAWTMLIDDYLDAVMGLSRSVSGGRLSLRVMM